MLIIPQAQVAHRLNSSVQVKNYLIISLCLTYLLSYFVHTILVELFLSLLSVIAFLISLFSAKTIPRILSLLMFFSGVFIFISKGSNIYEISSGVTSNLPLLTLVILVPLLAIPLKLEGYFHTVEYFLKKISSDSSKLFGGISFLIFCLGPILNLGSIRLLHETIKDLKLPSFLLAKSYLVGFSTVILWSPYFASVALVLYYLKVPVSEYLPLGLSLAFIQLLAGNILFRIYMKQKSPVNFPKVTAKQKKIPIERDQTKQFIHLCVTLAFLMGIIFVLEFLTKWPMMLIVSLTSIIYPIIWCLLKKRWAHAKRSFADFRRHSLPNMDNETILFISAGLFGKALTGTQFSAGLRSALNDLAGISFLFFTISIICAVVLLCFIGIHQIVVVTALATQIDPYVIGTTPPVIALLLMVSWAISAVLSPVNPLNLLVSSAVQHPGLSVGLKWNGVYLLTMFVIGVLFVNLIH
ncbi:hypothetical protein JOC77_001097 [Peribacillus deserti]|uniref:Citrate transporter-like domain-containing protein n=1 Tax=Peribacillus deserti TaxID=673318 RepID=A0ABS2QFE5_9BACI|nr:hypothetical protein [Peribacillus deserti]MBM7691690.1 hypothetical protein [Peribacillus deserti]